MRERGLTDATVVDHEDAVRVDDGGQAVRDDYGGLRVRLRQRIDGLLNHLFKPAMHSVSQPVRSLSLSYSISSLTFSD